VWLCSLRLTFHPYNIFELARIISHFVQPHFPASPAPPLNRVMPCLEYSPFFRYCFGILFIPHRPFVSFFLFFSTLERPFPLFARCLIIPSNFFSFSVFCIALRESGGWPWLDLPPLLFLFMALAFSCAPLFLLFCTTHVPVPARAFLSAFFFFFLQTLCFHLTPRPRFVSLWFFCQLLPLHFLSSRFLLFSRGLSIFSNGHQSPICLFLFFSIAPGPFFNIFSRPFPSILSCSSLC